MNLPLEIYHRYSKFHALKIVAWIGKDKERFEELMQLLFSDDEKIVLRASWLFSMCAEKHPQLIVPWLKKIIAGASAPNAPGAVKRNVVRTLQFVSIPKSLQGKVVNLCFEFLKNPQEAVAVKAFSMTVLANIAQQQPDLKHEIKLVIEEMLPYGSGGIISRGKKVLKQLTGK